MSKLYACVAQQHDLAMVALAALICAFGAYATFTIGVHTRALDRGAARRLWLATTVLTSACSIWATHFVAMLSFRVPMPHGFLAVPTVSSFVVVVSFLALAGRIGIDSRRRVTAAKAGALLGLSISTMHFVGMSAFRVVGTIVWDPVLVVASIVVATAFAILSALSVGGRARLRVALPSACFVAAVCSGHFIAMSAATIVYDPSVALPANVVDGAALTLPVATIALLSLVFALTASSLDVRARRQRLAERRRLEDFADFSVEGLAICDGGTVVWANRSLAQQLRADCVGKPLAALLSAETIAGLSDGHEIDASLGDGAQSTPVRVITKSIVLDGRPHTAIAFRDQRERLEAEAEMVRLANSDPLTGLANRTRFNETLAHLLTSRRAGERTFALLSLDLDRFKLVNDAHGHAAGDALLVRVAQRLGALVREGSLVARVGGDEFSIIVAPIAGPDAVRALADRLVDVLSRPFLIDGQVHEIGTSVGVALAPSDGDTAEALVRNADLALYRAKEDGGGLSRLFETGMDARMQARRGLELALRRAVARHEFELHYQPQVDARTGGYTGAEALIRWTDAERGVVTPAEFIPIAEETNLITTIGEWVLHTACTQAATWPDHLTIAVNLSPVQFRDPRLLSIVTAALEESGLPGHRLELEITESVLIQDEATVLALLRSFKRLGVRISLDDFGTGYSSLGHLHRFPFDKIKIDRSFVSRAPHDRDSAAIVRAVVSLAGSLEMTTTAEGVETDAQRRFVAGEGCDQIQGFLFSRPVPADRMPDEFRTAPFKEQPWLSFESSIAATAS